MAWFRRAAGVKLFLAIWIVVWVFPLGRLRAVRQWKNPQLIEQSAQTGTGATPELQLGLMPRDAQRLADQFPGDAAAQLTALSQPNLGRSDVFSPSNAQMQAASNPYFSRFAALSARFPRDLNIRAQWLRDATRGALRIQSEDLIATYHLSSQTVLAPNWMSRAQIEAAIGCASAGEAQEKDNAFWPWMEAIFQFSLRRDEAALRALERAGGCPRFSDRTRETVRRRIGLMRRVQVADTEDEFEEAWSITFPHYSRLRSAARQAMWQSKLAFDAGDKKRALEIAGILQRAGAPVSQSDDSMIVRLVGEALSCIAWSLTLKNADVAPPEWAGDLEDQQASRAELARRFATYARSEGRADLAIEAQNIAASFNGLALSNALRTSRFTDLSEQQNRLGLVHWLAAWLLKLAVFGALIWGAMLFLSPRDATPQTRRAMAITAAFCIGATGAVLASGVRLGAIPDFALGWEPATSTRTLDFNHALPWALAAIWAAPILGWALLAAVKFSRQNDRVVSSRLRVALRTAQWAVNTSVLAGCAVVFDALSQQPGDTIASQLWPAPPWILAILWLAAVGLWLWRAPVSLRVAIAFLALSLTGALWWFFFRMGTRVGYADVSFDILNDNPVAGVAISVLALASLVLALRQIDFRGTFGGHFCGELTTRIRLAAAILAVASSMTYSGVALFSLPIRAQAQRTLTKYLEIGEPRFIEESLGQNNR